METFNGVDDNCNTKIDECIVDCNCGTDLFGCYTFDETSTDGAVPPNNCNAAPPLADYGPGKVNEGLIVGSLELFAPQINAQNTQTFTVSAWVKLTDSGNDGYVFDVRRQYSMIIDSNGHVVCQVWTNDTNADTATTSSALNTNEFHHVACTYNGATLTAYLDGSGVSNVINDSVRTGVSHNFYFGNESVSDNWLPGVLDHVQAFNTAHSAKQVCLAAERTDCP